jgi:hypothetical protein
MRESVNCDSQPGTQNSKRREAACAAEPGASEAEASKQSVPAANQLTNYVYHLYGDEEVFLAEASYSIGTLRKRTDPNKTRIIMFTDRPARVRSLPVICESIADDINEMRGPAGYGYRVKLCCILKCAEQFPGNIVYLDCDTIVTGPIHEVAVNLGNSRALMYKRERLAGRFPQFEGFHTRLPGNVPYRFGPESWMFNAGVIGIHPENAPILKNALAICDALLLEGRQNHVCEQFAVSEAFRLAGLKILEAHKVVAHYYRGSAKRYMHHEIPRFAARIKKELWSFDRPIPYSYPRVQLFKLMERLFK